MFELWQVCNAVHGALPQHASATRQHTCIKGPKGIVSNVAFACLTSIRKATAAALLLPPLCSPLQLP
jgi:hypothetical protein